MIDKTFSKGDLLEIISRFSIHVPDCATLDKLRLSIMLWTEINNMGSIPEDNEIYMIKTLEELKIYLTNPNPDKVLSVKQKQKIMRFCKEVIIYCTNGYLLECSIFQNLEEIYIQMRDLRVYGDIPSVRRAIRLLNEDPKLSDKIVPVISNKMKRQLEMKSKKKVKKYYGLIRKTGTFVVDFN